MTMAETMSGPTFVTRAQVITSDTSVMRGHGTYQEDKAIVSAVAGVVEQVNKLITVRPLRARYAGEIGDVVVGRITEVGQRRWKVDVNARQDGVLLLSSVNLPGGVQRRKSESDELQMRKFFTEGDMLVAEAQAFFQDGAMSIHTRSLKYGKLRNGVLVVVPPSLVLRSRSHFHTLANGIEVIIGLNGYIWVCKRASKAPEQMEPDELYADVNEEIGQQERDTIARICNCLRGMADRQISIDYTKLAAAYEASLGHSAKELLQANVMETVLDTAMTRM
ncbi:hypothetical protein SYNPS1DRAFT_32716 [Syncephalis pseudoplumigaleata]|uniref:Uncharacterized protein n=1 Tax=Syncephalis pseudoplumigaleata TaxID=1712513 RepID=A0A4P9Z2C6_9FUNG|nr:hypothetical protein SYNPS1DRAFT_32716 [Syncephalis pseudoplumigaleata]|eukprot:RKP26515.1 hypothetical protein SYNPS1DRAFT_32716 [Syncephalis pseudoplumigaleata]